jgi:hypothetical protein
VVTTTAAATTTEVDRASGLGLIDEPGGISLAGLGVFRPMTTTRAILVAAITLAAAPATAGPGAAYAKLFVPRTAWRYRVSERVRAGSRWTTTRARVRCEVAEVRPYPGGVMARVECSPDAPVAGVWIEDARGLWRTGTLPAGAPDLAQAELMLEAAPAALDASDGDLERTVTRVGRAWCVELDEGGVAGPDNETSYCFDGAIASASSGSHAAGERTEAERDGRAAP